jgi:hypothetical protein
MTAAGEWLPEWLRAWPTVDEEEAELARAQSRADVDGAGAPPPAPAPSLVSGAIGRALTDARAAYRQHLADQWHEIGAEGPTVHACTVAELGQEGQEGRSPH